MDKIEVIKINENRFKAFVMFTKTPNLISFFKELEFYSTGDTRILGTVTIDSYDKDYNCVILCRDEVGKFKAVELKTSIKSLILAREWLITNMKWLACKGEYVHPQGDKKEGVDLFKIVVSKDNIHPYFKILNEAKSFEPAKTMLQELTKFFNDIDGNFVEQFQSKNGFDARLWELYMFCFLTEQGFSVSRNDERPDFIVDKMGDQIAIEAVIVARKDKILESPSSMLNGIPEITLDKAKKAMPLKYSNALVQKLKKKYWELPNVKGLPLIFSIADFHGDLSMTWSFNALVEYLYGYQYPFYYDKDGSLILKPEKISHYKKENGAEVHAGFFSLPETENISGVLFSSMGTLPKFTRMGIQAGFKKEGLRALRWGSCYDHDRNASKPKYYLYDVTEDSTETWSEGVNLYHNPNAKYPIDRKLFPTIAHHSLINEFVHSEMPDFHPFFSVQINTQKE